MRFIFSLPFLTSGFLQEISINQQFESFLGLPFHSMGKAGSKLGLPFLGHGRGLLCFCTSLESTAAINGVIRFCAHGAALRRHAFHPIRIFFQFRTGFPAPSSRVFWRVLPFSGANYYISLPSSFAEIPSRMILDPRERSVLKGYRAFSAMAGVALFLDPLFLYIPGINSSRECAMSFDGNLLITAAVLRSVADALHLIPLFFQFRTAFPGPYSRELGSGRMVVDTSAIASRYLFSFFLVDLLSVLPLPQVIVVVAWISGKNRGSRMLTAIAILQPVIASQFLPRLFRFNQFIQEVRSTTTLAVEKAAFARIAITIFLYINAAHVRLLCFRPRLITTSTARIFHPLERVVRRWDAIFLALTAVALFLDPLFLYIPRINSRHGCVIRFDGNLVITATVLRSVADAFHLIRIFFRFRTGFPAPSSRVFGAGELVMDASAIARRYLSSYFIVDLLSVLPLPQVIVVAAWISGKTRGSRLLTAIAVLQPLIASQFVPRLFRFYQLSQKAISTSYAVRKAAVARIWVTVFLYVNAAHVVGAFWYSLAIRREMGCWRAACRSRPGCDYEAMLTCGKDRSMNYTSFLNQSCPRGGGSDFNYGMYADAISSGVLESTDFGNKLLYSFWWALQSLSTLGQNIKPSNNKFEICFALCIFIAGLLLFSLVIGIIQTRMLASTIRMEEMRMKWEGVERWMGSHYIPEDLKERLKQHEEFRWQRDQGVDIHNVLQSLPRDLRRDITRHLWLDLLRSVPIFSTMDDEQLDAMCERVKPALYTGGSYIVREGDRVNEMLFIKRGVIQTTGTYGGSSVFFSAEHLKTGEFCCDELLSWALGPYSSLSDLPISITTVQTVTHVEAFALTADDLKFVATRFRWVRNKKLRHRFRFYSHQWTTWAACFIQAAWRRFRKNKLEMAQRREEDRLGDALAAKSTPLGATIYASRFAANSLRLLNRKSTGKGTVPLPSVSAKKPAEPDFSDDEVQSSEELR
ncbi:unnamed protein product [Linum trigynum]|uniref:Cyclic nucleotide-binding domain-containing protein n=1 Tax=Linum trigynum TaxID=586398 RepID=A0AAV2GG46_9ROSI